MEQSMKQFSRVSPREMDRQGVILTAKGKEEPDHVFRVAILPLVHVDLDPRFDRLLSK